MAKHHTDIQTTHTESHPGEAPLISVVIPAYKAAAYLTDCLDSLLAQTYRPLEIIVVDDQSPDDGATIRHAEEYARQHDITYRENQDQPLSMLVLQNEINGGPGMARAYGLRFIHGDYVMFMDSDDLLRADALEKMLHVALLHDADMVKSEFELLHSDGTVSNEQTGAPVVYSGHATLMTLARNIMSPPPHIRRVNGPNGSPCGVYRAALLRDPEVFFPPVPHLLSEDYIFNFRFLRKAKSIVYYPTSFYRYRFVSNSFTHAPRTDILERAVTASQHFETTVRELEPGDELSVMHARGYLIGSIISSCTIYLLSDNSMKEKRRWFNAQRQIPIFRTLYEEYPWRKLVFSRRLGFISFYKGRFGIMYTILRGRQIVTSLFKRFYSRSTLS